MHAGQLDALVGDADGGWVRLRARGPPGTVAGVLLGAKGGPAMRKLMEFLELLLARLRRLITGQR